MHLFFFLISERIPIMKMDSPNIALRIVLLNTSENGDHNTVQNIINSGFNVNEADVLSETALHKAAKNGHLNVVEYLLTKKANVNAENMKYLTPLHYAALNDHKVLVYYLLKHGADLNAKTKNDWTPLHIVTQKGHNDLVECLLKHGADVNAKNKTNWTPLHFAASEGKKVSTIECLLKHGAELNVKTKNGKTPLELAIESKNILVVDFLKSYIENNIEPSNKRQRLDEHQKIFIKDKHKLLKPQNQGIEQIVKEKTEFQKKCQEYERMNSELQEQLRLTNEKLNQQINEVEQKKFLEKEFHDKVQDYAMLNLELQKELRVEKSEKEKLNQKNQELERRIAMLQNADNVYEFEQDCTTSVKQEYIKNEIKLEIDQ